MAIIRPFKAYRPLTGLVKEIAAPPYDVVNSEEAREIVSRNKYSFLRIDRGETTLSKDINKYDDAAYEQSRNLLNDMIGKGIYIQDEEAYFYIYRQIMAGKSQTGLVACASVDDYMDNNIKKHENIRYDKEIDRIKHIKYCSAHTGPIFIVYRENYNITDIIDKWTKKEPLYNFIADDNVTHIVWKIDGKEDIDKLRSLFNEVKSMYVADGHHRIEAAARVAAEVRKNKKDFNREDEVNYFLSILYPDSDVKILDYNRTVRDLNGYTKDEFLDKIRKNFKVVKSEGNKPVAPDRKHNFGMYIDKEWYLLEAGEGVENKENKIQDLDVSILQNNVLSPILGIDDPRKSDRIEFIGGIRGLKELERRADTDMAVSFSLYPIGMDDIMDIADSKGIMPPKSTWFEPKPMSGIFIHKFN